MLASFPGAASAMNRRTAFALALLVVGLCARPALGQGAVAGDTQELQTKIAQDPELRKYPHLQQFVERILAPHRRESLGEDRSLARLLEDAKQIDSADRQSMRLVAPEVYAFFEACVADKLTMLRANGLLARVVSWSNVVLIIDGRDTDAALQAQHLSVGLSLPMQHAVLFAYIPHRGSEAPFLCRFLAVYDRAFTYSYGKDVMNESVVIGAAGGPRLSARKGFDDRQPSGPLYLVESDILYKGPAVGFYNIKGVTIAGWKAIAFGAVDAMFVEDGTLTIKGTHWLEKNVSGFERPEAWSRVGIHPEPSK